MRILNHFAIIFTGCLFASGLAVGCTHSLPEPSSSVQGNRDNPITADISCHADIKVVSPGKGYALSRMFAFMKASADIRSVFEERMSEKVRSVLLALSRGEKPDSSDEIALLIAEKAEDIYRARAAANGKEVSSLADFLKDFIVSSPAFPDDCAGFVQLFMPGLRIVSIREENNKIVIYAVFSPEQYRLAKQIIDRNNDKGAILDFAVNEAPLPAEMSEAICCFGWRIGKDSIGEPILFAFGQGVAVSDSPQSQSKAYSKASLDSQNELRKALAELIIAASVEKLLRERPLETINSVSIAAQAADLRKKCSTLTIRGSKKLKSSMFRLSSSEIVSVQATGMKPLDIMSSMKFE